MEPQSASSTSLNYQGFEEMKGFGTPSLLYGRIFIEPNRRSTAGKGAIAATKPPPGQTPYLRARRAAWSKSVVAQERNQEAVVAVVTKKGEEGVDKDCEMR